MDAIEVPGDADIRVLHAILSHHNGEWALREPHRAWQVHAECLLGECIAKSIAWGALVNLGVIEPDSHRPRELPAPE